MKKYRIGVIGFAHMHIGGLADDFNRMSERYEWIGCADTTPRTPSVSDQPATRRTTLREVCEMCHMPRVFEQYEDLLDEKPDLVLVTSENATHAQVALAALERGVGVVFEKPMATSARDAENMARLAKMRGTLLAVNWPTTWDPAIRTAQRLTRDGAVGTPFKFHYRNTESLGPFSYGQTLTDYEKSREWWYQTDMGGGAMMDYLGYGLNLSRFFLGERPIAAFAMRANFQSPFSDADDYSAMSVRYPGAIALLEGSWATFSSGDVPCGPVVFGDKGTLVSRREGVCLYTTRHNDKPDRVVAPDPLPEHRKTLAQEITFHLDTGAPLHETLDMPVNLDAMAALDAGLKSADSGKLEIILP